MIEQWLPPKDKIVLWVNGKAELLANAIASKHGLRSGENVSEGWWRRLIGEEPSLKKAEEPRRVEPPEEDTDG